ncbi:type III-B CRISPR module RAMP protein Cmr6 [Halothiobacillus diazotrophicus]|uniref:Type III-B CRISPR module RAMP protein Cmr6 n=1 Tax=Halothiobacillus diazotrophicus TaxID=1860122 RepID=A0A191ZFK2_9GAMM|nr:type III-B CRISPR module RAMP protein Cmr6 [Halothiobacillus diazotrophicus]ANJ66659.1 type III-B CRISPR module RAMP protein Cmr6 [Halothiobacillus diazotrophicus]
MTAPIYGQGDLPGSCPDEAHRGLWFERFYDQYDSATWAVLKPRGNQDKQGNTHWLLSEFHGREAGSAPALERHNAALAELVGGLGGQVLRFHSGGHLVTGMGNPHPVENGFAWHPTLGVPYLSGAAVKGLLRSYIETHLDAEGAELRGLLRQWFGSADKDPNKVPDAQEATQRGALVFFDALPVRPVTLSVDVMTPHMGQWYARGDKVPGPDAVPADWHQPVPVPFLAARDIELQFGFCLRPGATGAATGIDLADVADALTRALTESGAGGKTATGYGALYRDVESEARLEAERTRRASERAETARKATLSPEDKAHEQDLTEVEAFRAGFAEARQRPYQPGGNFERERLAFMERVLAWTDPRSRRAAGDLLAETLTRQWGTPGKKERKQQIQEAIRVLRGEE